MTQNKSSELASSDVGVYSERLMLDRLSICLTLLSTLSPPPPPSWGGSCSARPWDEGLYGHALAANPCSGELPGDPGPGCTPRRHNRLDQSRKRRSAQREGLKALPWAALLDCGVDLWRGTRYGKPELDLGELNKEPLKLPLGSMG